MTQKRDLILIKLAFFAALFAGVLALSVLLAPAAEAGLPARNTPIPNPPPPPADAGDDEEDDILIGAWIELEVSGASASAWTVVQWQNEWGDWYDVEGWRGSLDGNGAQRWWVHQKDFGDGPFRWVVTQSKDDPVLGVSQEFNLPGGANETVWVTVSPGP